MHESRTWNQVNFFFSLGSESNSIKAQSRERKETKQRGQQGPSKTKLQTRSTRKFKLNYKNSSRCFLHPSFDHTAPAGGHPRQESTRDGGGQSAQLYSSTSPIFTNANNSDIKHAKTTHFGNHFSNLNIEIIRTHT